MTNLRLATFRGQTSMQQLNWPSQVSYEQPSSPAKPKTSRVTDNTGYYIVVFEHTKLQRRDVTFNHGQRRAFHGSTQLVIC